MTGHQKVASCDLYMIFDILLLEAQVGHHVVLILIVNQAIRWRLVL
jgi:hypothetical protein